MIKFIKDKWKLFLTAFFQVLFVAMQPLFIVNHMIIAMMLTGFAISLIWTFNVKRVAFGGMADRFVYATGAMLGTLVGYLISKNLIQI